MKHIAITFDDGRSDNCLLAKPIMDRYQFAGTVYITTGFIDGSWEQSAVLQSPSEPLTIAQILQLQEGQWEIGLHGDKHQTQVDDMGVALNKLLSWDLRAVRWGISVPNSDTNDKDVAALYDSEYGEKIAYIRRGRKCDTSKLYYRALYGIYTLLNAKWAYRRFNAENTFDLGNADMRNIPSIVVKANDKPEWILALIQNMPDNHTVVLMLHSILPADHPQCGKDPWSWEDQKLEELCAGLKKLEANGEVIVAPLAQLLKGQVKDGQSR